MKTEPETVTVTQAAKLLNVSERTVRRRVKARKLHLLRPVPKHKKRRQYILLDKAFAKQRITAWLPPDEKNGTVNLDDEQNIPATSFRGGCTAHIWIPTEGCFNPADPSTIQTVTESFFTPSEQLEYLMLKMTRLADKTEHEASVAAIHANKASQKEEQCSLSVTHASEWCNKAQKAYIACAEERRGSLRCAAWCTLACIVAALILIANLFA